MITADINTLHRTLGIVLIATGFTERECAIVALKWLADHHYSETGHWFQPTLNQTASHIQQGHALTQQYGVSLTDWQNTKGEQAGYAALCVAEGCEGD